MRWAGHVAGMIGRGVTYRILVWRPVGNRQLGRTKRRWEDNNKIDIQEVRWQPSNLLICLRISTGS